MGQVNANVRATQLRDLIKEAGTVLPDHEVEVLAKKIEQSDLPLFDHPKDPAPQNVLEKANELIHGERLQHYGHPNVNFKRIASAWTQYLQTKLKKDNWIDPVDVTMMMILLKVMRIAEGYHSDSVIDIGGYTALAAILAGEDVL